MRTQKEALIRHVRATARAAGLVLRTQNCRINGGQAFQFCDRDSGRTVMSNCTLDSALGHCESGFISSYDKNSGSFRFDFGMTEE